jgi:hypothetical protein
VTCLQSTYFAPVCEKKYKELWCFYYHVLKKHKPHSNFNYYLLDGVKKLFNIIPSKKLSSVLKPELADIQLNKYKIVVVNGCGSNYELLVDGIDNVNFITSLKNMREIRRYLNTSLAGLAHTMEEFEHTVQKEVDEYLGTPKERVM